MPAKAYFVVRAVVGDEAMRSRFDQWYATDHLPWAIKVLGAEKAWRLWSELDASVHVAVYQCADKDRLSVVLKSEEFKALVADFDRAWPSGIARTRDVLNLVDSQAP